MIAFVAPPLLLLVATLVAANACDPLPAACKRTDGASSTCVRQQSAFCGVAGYCTDDCLCITKGAAPSSTAFDCVDAVQPCQSGLRCAAPHNNVGTCRAATSDAFRYASCVLDPQSSLAQTAASYGVNVATAAFVAARYDAHAGTLAVTAYDTRVSGTRKQAVHCEASSCTEAPPDQYGRDVQCASTRCACGPSCREFTQFPVATLIESFSGAVSMVCDAPPAANDGDAMQQQQQHSSKCRVSGAGLPGDAPLVCTFYACDAPCADACRAQCEPRAVAKCRCDGDSATSVECELSARERCDAQCAARCAPNLVTSCQCDTSGAVTRTLCSDATLPPSATTLAPSANIHMQPSPPLPLPPRPTPPPDTMTAAYVAAGVAGLLCVVAACAIGVLAWFLMASGGKQRTSGVSAGAPAPPPSSSSSSSSSAAAAAAAAAMPPSTRAGNAARSSSGAARKSSMRSSLPKRIRVHSQAAYAPLDDTDSDSEGGV